MRAAAMMLASMIMVLPAGAAGSDAPRNYVITIDGQEVPIDIGQKLTIKAKDGHAIEVGLKQSEIGTFSGNFVTFQHGKDVSVTSSDIEAGLKQHMMATNTGTLVLVQEYGDLDPRSLAELMLTQISKDDVKGGKLSQLPGKRKLASGLSLDGLTASIAIKKGKRHYTARYEVMTAGTSDHGIVAVTRIDDDLTSKDQQILDRFWETLTVKL